MNPDISEGMTRDDQQVRHGADEQAPHACEFCSPEPQPIPAPSERQAGERAVGEALWDAPSAKAAMLDRRA